MVTFKGFVGAEGAALMVSVTGVLSRLEQEEPIDCA
jgi:hypothetical protein